MKEGMFLVTTPHYIRNCHFSIYFEDGIQTLRQVLACFVCKGDIVYSNNTGLQVKIIHHAIDNDL